MQALAEEWRRRDAEREALVQKKVESLQTHTSQSQRWVMVGGRQQ